MCDVYFITCVHAYFIVTGFFFIECYVFLSYVYGKWCKKNAPISTYMTEHLKAEHSD